MLVIGPMRRFIAVLIVLLALPLAADDVHLKNGRVFEDVDTRIVGSQVIVLLSYGEIGFSLDAVDRIEESTSSHSVYRQRREELRANPDVAATAWLELAGWAQGRGLEHGARESALVAARLDPALSGLGPLMGALDFVRDADSQRWIPRQEALRRAGYVRVDGQWLSAEQQRARADTALAAARVREADEERRLTRAVLALAAAQLAETARRESSPQASGETVYAWPVAVFPNPFRWRHPNPHKLPPRRSDPTALPIERRQPGSLFPIESRGRLTVPGDGSSTSRTTSGGSG